MVKRTSFVLNHASKSIEVGRGGSGRNLSTKTMATNRCHCDVLLVHPSDDISCDAVHIIRGMMVRLALIAIVEEPDIADFQDLVSTLAKEFREVLCRLRDLWKPNHGRQVLLATLHEGALKSDLVAPCSHSRL